MYRISKEFGFEAAHHLVTVPENHPCRRPHGHSYRVRVTLWSDELDHRGFVVDYRELDPIKEFIDRELDHRDLNQVFDFPTTAENIARHLYEVCRGLVGPRVCSVAVSETAKTWAEYSGGYTK